MATKIITLLTDDIDGTDAKETVTFALDGTKFEIDLNEENAAKLRAAFAPYKDAGRRLTRGQRPYRVVSAEPTQREVRRWAQNSGLNVPARGRVPDAVISQYKAAH